MFRGKYISISNLLWNVLKIKGGELCDKVEGNMNEKNLGDRYAGIR